MIIEANKYRCQIDKDKINLKLYLSLDEKLKIDIDNIEMDLRKTIYNIYNELGILPGIKTRLPSINKPYIYIVNKVTLEGTNIILDVRVNYYAINITDTNK